jgi:hypothetical protein
MESGGTDKHPVLYALASGMDSEFALVVWTDRPRGWARRLFVNNASAPGSEASPMLSPVAETTFTPRAGGRRQSDERRHLEWYRQCVEKLAARDVERARALWHFGSELLATEVDVTTTSATTVASVGGPKVVSEQETGTDARSAIGTEKGRRRPFPTEVQHDAVTPQLNGAENRITAVTRDEPKPNGDCSLPVR